MTFQLGQKYVHPSNTKNGKKDSPWDTASLFGKYSLFFIISLLRKGRRQLLQHEDIGMPPKVDSSRRLGLKLQNKYNQELLKRTLREPSFLRAIFATFGWQLVMISMLDLMSKCVAYPMITIALGWLIRDTTVYLTVSLKEEQEFQMANNITLTSPPVQLTMPGTNTAIPDTLTSSGAYWNIVLDGCLLILSNLLALSLSHPYFFQTWHIGMKCRIAACYLVYKKALRLSQSAMSETTVGQMVNLLSNDVNRFDLVAQSIPALVIAPIQAAVVITILSLFYLGLYPTMASLSAIIIYVLIQTSMGRGFSKFRSQTAKRTDERVRLMNEIILAMRIIKMYGWEKPFKQLVSVARRREITTIGVASILRSINQTLFFVSSKIIVFVALITYVLMGNSFNPEIVFVSIGLANLIRLSLTLFFPTAISYSAETLISCKRINNFLLLPEINNSSSSYKVSSDLYGCKYVVTMNKVYASWAAKDQDTIATSDARWAIIRNLSLQIKPRDLVLIVGRVGSGKSSTLMSMLGELPIASGRLEVNGKISYASQEAWIFSGTIRDNILFGLSYDADRYNEVIRVCSLERDIEILIDGDMTIVGERGVSLSGGQKARVNLARALYNEADIYILDDPLSAVDAPVAKHIFNESLRTFLKKKTVILATHQLQFLRYATKVLVVDRDSPAAYGTLQEVMESEAFAVVNYSKETFEEATTTEAGTDAETSRIIQTRTPPQSGSSSKRSSRKSSRITPPVDGEGSPKPSRPSQERSPELQTEDRLQTSNDGLIREASQASSNLNESVKIITPRDVYGSGSVLGDKVKSTTRKISLTSTSSASNSSKSNVADGQGNDMRKGLEQLTDVSTDLQTYLYYLKNATGPIMFVWFILANVAAQTLYQYTDWFLSYWTDSVQRHELLGDAFVPITYVDSLTTNEISSLYAILVALTFFVTFCRTSTFFIGTLRASINMHDKLFNSIVRSPMKFFDFSPIGILLNRFSRDVGFVDETLPATAIEIITIFVNISGIIVMTILIDWKNVGISLVLIVLAYILKRFCSRTIIRLKQIEGVTRSPIYSHISTTLSGLATIRAFKVQDNFIKIFDRQQDIHSGTWFSYLVAGRFLGLCMDWLCLIYISSVITLLLAFSLDASNASFVGLLISQSVVLSGPFQWGIRQLIETESQMTSVQRIKEFSQLKAESDDLEIEEDGTMFSSKSSLSSKNQAAVFKPKYGEIKFVDLSLSYFTNEPPVLKGLNFTIKPREKIGVVGRTGAGKSSIVSVLFRLYPFEGSVLIDGVDTKSLTLSQLRRSMSIIPQDPILFGGTIRKNLDPFSEYPDDELWSALEAVKLKTLFSNYQQGLEYLIQEGGFNFSVGQRQLICLARAIVRKNKILILDEATANVDPETDVFIQKTISQQFKQCTVITIAHRLITIVDSDKVLVLDGGQVREYEAPFELIQDETSLFGQMVNSSAEQAPRLKKLIEDEHRRREREKTQPASPPPPTTT